MTRQAGVLASYARRVPGVVWVAAIALVAWLSAPHAPYPHYDFAYAIAAGQDILEGRTSAYALPVKTPLPHPFGTFLGVFSAGFGSAAFTVWVVIGLLFFGLMVYSVFQLGRHIFTWPVGLFAAALVFTASEVFLLGVRTYGDVKFAAFVLFAAVLEVRRPRRGWPVLVLLALAGLLRPEAWFLAGLYSGLPQFEGIHRVNWPWIWLCRAKWMFSKP